MSTILGTTEGDSILRVERSRNLNVPLTALNEDTDLSWKAVGLLSYLLTRPDGWKFYRSDLTSRHADGEHAVDSGLEELKDGGYLEIDQVRRPDGTFAARWTVCEAPGSTDPQKSGSVTDPQFSGSENRGTEMLLEEDVCSSLRSSPGEAGQEDEDSEDDDSDSPPSPSSFNSEEWVCGVQAGDRQLSEGIYPLLWRGEEVPESSPREWSFRAEMGTLSRLKRDYGASDHETALFMVGLHRMREAGDLSGVDPGDGLTTGYAKASEAWDTEVLWHSALRRGRRWWQEVAPTDGAVLNVVAGGADA